MTMGCWNEQENEPDARCQLFWDKIITKAVGRVEGMYKAALQELVNEIRAENKTLNKRVEVLEVDNATTKAVNRAMWKLTFGVVPINAAVIGAVVSGVFLFFK